MNGSCVETRRARKIDSVISRSSHAADGKSRQPQASDSAELPKVVKASVTGHKLVRAVLCR